MLKHLYIKMIEYLADKTFFKNIITLMSGTILSQIITVISVSFLSRMYSPEKFGEYALFISCAAVLSVFFGCKYELAILLPDKREESINIVFLCIATSIGTCILFMGALLLFGQDVMNLLNIKIPLSLILLIPSYSCFMGFYQALYNWFNREKKFVIMSKSKMILSVSSVFFSIILFTFSKDGLILGVILGQLIVLIYMFHMFYKDIRHINIKDVFDVAKRYIDFPKFSIITTFISIVSDQVPVFLLSVFYGANVVGYFSLGQRCINMPISVITQAFGDIFREKVASKLKKKQSFTYDFDYMIKKLIIISIFPSIILLIWAPDIFIIFFGEQWAEAGLYTQILVPMYFFKCLASPVSSVYVITEKQKIGLFFQVFIISILLIGIYLGKLIFDDEKISIAFLGWAYVIACILSIYINRKLTYR